MNFVRIRLVLASAVLSVGLVGTAVAVTPASDAGASAVTTPWPGGTWTPDPATYGMVTVQNVPIVMDDGATLYTDIGYPINLSTGQRAAGNFPVLLSQNPYGSLGSIIDLPGIGTEPDPYFVDRGYIYMVADVRGTTARSDTPVTINSTFFSPRNAQDGVDLVNYAAHQLSGSNGTVGLIGCSFLGISELFTAAAIGPGSPVKAMVPACSSMGYELFFDGGVPGADIGDFSLAPPEPFAIDQGAAVQLQDNVSSGGSDAYDSTYWQERDLAADANEIVNSGIPALLWTGWQALEAQGAVDLYSALQNAAEGRNPYAMITSGEPVTGRYQIVVGSGGHGLGLDSAFQLEWFDRYLKGANDGIDQTSTPMHLYENNSGRWINVPALPSAAPTAYYLNNFGDRLGTQSPLLPSAASLTWAQPSQSGTTLTYNSAPLTQPMTVAGPTEVTVDAASTTTNMELVATLEDVTPTGSVTDISDGALIGSMSSVDKSKSWIEPNGQMVKPYHPFTSDTSLKPYTFQQFDVAISTALYSVPAGDSLRLVLSTQAPSSSCSLLSVLSPVQACLPTSTQQASLTGSTYYLLSGGTSGSVINIPLVHPNTLPATLGCSTSTSNSTAEPMNWNGGTLGQRNPLADLFSCLSLSSQ